MKLSEEMAVRLHRMMWSDMQRELGDNPRFEDRKIFKCVWINENFPDEHVQNCCFLCEYAKAPWAHSEQCKSCPIRWPGDTCCPEAELGGVYYGTSPISDILALPTRCSGLPYRTDTDEYVELDKKSTIELAYCLTKEKLSRASGLEDFCTADEHIAEIKKKEDRAVMQVLENFSGLKGEGCWVVDHVKAIQKKAVDEYFEKTPGAKLVSMDVDDAFRQYAKEQMEPLKQQNDRLTKRHIEAKNRLAQESGLDRNRPVDDHIREIVKNSMEAGATEERDRIQEKIYEVLLS